jgi:hypothetical protein
MQIQEVSKIIRMGLQEGAKHCFGDWVKTTQNKIHWPRWVRVFFLGGGGGAVNLLK